MRNQLIFSTLVLGLLVALPIGAADSPVARVPVEEYPADSEARALLDGIRARGNRPINLNLVSALSPKLARARSALVSTIRYELVVPRALRELTILRTAQLAPSMCRLRSPAATRRRSSIRSRSGKAAICSTKKNARCLPILTRPYAAKPTSMIRPLGNSRGCSIPRRSLK